MKKSIRAIVVRVGQEPIAEEIEDDLDAYHKIVGGYIEVVPLASGIILVCNEDGIRLGLPFNRCRITGDFFVVREDHEDFASVTTEDERKIRAWCKANKDQLPQRDITITTFNSAEGMFERLRANAEHRQAEWEKL